MKQLLAVAGAALLIALAVVVRGALDDDGDSGDDGDGRGDGGELVVACVRELREACEAIDGVGELRVEDPADTIAAAGEVDAWVTFDPWPAIAAEEQRREVFEGTPVPVGSSELVLVSRTDALAEACAEDPNWACVVDVAPSAAPALPPPTTALGALLLGHAAADWSAVVRPGEPFARNEFELPEFRAWLGGLDVSADPVADMLQFAPAGPAATGTTLADFDRRVASSPRAGGLRETVGDAVVAIVVAGPRAGRVAGDDGFLGALEDLGWHRTPDAVTTGLPNPGVLLALSQEL